MGKTEESDKYLNIGADAYAAGDYEKAKAYYEKSAALGNDQAACNLGYIYEYGRTGERDYEQAFYFYSEAVALANNPNALYKIGDCYFYGNFVTKNDYLAFLNYKNAANAADYDDAEDLKSDIYYRLAFCYFKGMGTDQNTLAALEYINQAQTYTYYDRKYKKFMWQSIFKRVAKLREQIVVALDE